MTPDLMPSRLREMNRQIAEQGDALLKARIRLDGLVAERNALERRIWDLAILDIVQCMEADGTGPIQKPVEAPFQAAHPLSSAARAEASSGIRSLAITDAARGQMSVDPVKRWVGIHAWRARLYVDVYEDERANGAKVNGKPPGTNKISGHLVTLLRDSNRAMSEAEISNALRVTEESAIKAINFLAKAGIIRKVPKGWTTHGPQPRGQGVRPA